MNSRHSDRNQDNSSISDAIEGRIPASGSLGTNVRKVQNKITASTRWSRRGIAGLAGSASALAMAPFFAWPVLFLTLPVLVWLIDSTINKSDSKKTHRPHQWPSKKQLASAASVGWWFGFGYFLCGLFWIGEAFLVEAHIFGWLMPFAVISMPAGLALFTAATAATARLFWSSGFERVFVLAISFYVTEWLRGHIFTGFPWNTIGYALTEPLSLMQSAGVLSVYGLTPWVVLIFATPLVSFGDTRNKLAQRARFFEAPWTQIILFSIVPILAMYIYGLSVLSAGTTPTVANVKIRIVQPSTPQRDKWRADKQEEIFFDHINLSKTDADGHIGRC